MAINNRNYKNPTVQTWESLRMFLQSFMERMNRFDSMTERQGRDIGIDEVFNEIQRMKQQLESIQKNLNLYNNTIPTDNQGINPPATNESYKRSDKIRLSESQLHRVIKESVRKVLKETSIYADDPYHYAEYYNEDPRYNYPNGKQGDIDYSWDEFDMRNGNMPFQQEYQHKMMDLKRKGRDFQQNWTPRELQRAERQKQRYISGGYIDDFTQEYQH